MAILTIIYYLKHSMLNKPTAENSPRIQKQQFPFAVQAESKNFVQHLARPMFQLILIFNLRTSAGCLQNQLLCSPDMLNFLLNCVSSTLIPQS